MSFALPLLAALALSQDGVPAPAPPAATRSAVPTPSPPPLVPLSDEPPPPPPPPPPESTTPGAYYQGQAARPYTPPTPLTGAVLFSPMSLFGLFLSVELEWAFSKQASAYATAGAGLLSQLAGEVGARYYVMEQALEGLFVEAHGQVFGAGDGGLMMVGPGAMLGWNWRASSGSSLLTSFGLGINAWVELSTSRARFGSTVPQRSGYIFFPGLQRPPLGGSAVQLTLRFCLGPGF